MEPAFYIINPPGECEKRRFVQLLSIDVDRQDNERRVFNKTSKAIMINISPRHDVAPNFEVCSIRTEKFVPGTNFNIA
jgi:hypothetical protein